MARLFLPSWIRVGAFVVTPSGKAAEVIGIDARPGGILEITVQWSNAERAAFRLTVLRPAIGDARR